MLKIAILEDEPKAAESLQLCIKRYDSENQMGISVDTFSNAEELLKKYDPDTDILFMDIELPGISGMEAAKIIRNKNKQVLIVFVTNLAQYAIDGYEVGAYDFILKPVRYASFSSKFEKICKELEQRRDDAVISVNTKEGVAKIYVTEIMYVEVQKHYIIIHTLTDNIKLCGTMESFVEMLGEHSFSQCNSCYLVNLRHITKIEKDNVFLGNDSIKMSRAKKKGFMQEVSEYF